MMGIVIAGTILLLSLGGVLFFLWLLYRVFKSLIPPLYFLGLLIIVSVASMHSVTWYQLFATMAYYSIFFFVFVVARNVFKNSSFTLSEQVKINFFPIAFIIVFLVVLLLFLKGFCFETLGFMNQDAMIDTALHQFAHKMGGTKEDREHIYTELKSCSNQTPSCIETHWDDGVPIRLLKFKIDRNPLALDIYATYRPSLEAIKHIKMYHEDFQSGKYAAISMYLQVLPCGAIRKSEYSGYVQHYYPMTEEAL